VSLYYAGFSKNRKKEAAQPIAKADETSVAKFFEEIKVMVGSVPERVAGQLGADPQARRMRRRRRLHPRMIEELLHHPMWRESPDAGGVPILVIFSLFRDDFPWLYEIAAQLYRAIEGGDSKSIERARKTLLNTIEMTTHGPFMHDMMNGPDDEEMLMLMHHFAHEIDRFIRAPKRLQKRVLPTEEK
jgi:hypothetical protein